MHLLDVFTCLYRFSEKDDKMLKKMILTSKQHAMHLFAGQNTQQPVCLKDLVSSLGKHFVNYFPDFYGAHLLPRLSSHAQGREIGEELIKQIRYFFYYCRQFFKSLSDPFIQQPSATSWHLNKGILCYITFELHFGLGHARREWVVVCLDEVCRPASGCRLNVASNLKYPF